MNRFVDFTTEAFKGKTVGRIIFNWYVKNECKDINGEVLDLAGGGASYYRYLPKGLSVTRTNIEDNNIDIRVDINKDLPFGNDLFDVIFLFNALYIIKGRKSLLIEIKRILKNGGLFFISTPLIVGEIPEPDDFVRLTFQGISDELKEAGFNNFEIKRMGGRFTSSTSLLHQFYYFNIIRFFVYGVAILFDRLTENFQKKSPAPLGYFCVVKK